MKAVIIIFLLLANVAIAQQAFQSGRYTVVRDNTATNLVPRQDGSIERFDVNAGTTEGQGQLLLSIVNRFFFYFNAAPTLAANISQEGTSGSWKITIPNTPTTNKAIFMPLRSIAIVYSGNKYGFDAANDSLFPLDIRNINTGELACRITEDGNVIWPDVTIRTASAISTTGLVQYTLQ